MLLPSFYQQTDVVKTAKQLLGKVLVCTLDGNYRAGLITETEAYHQSEKACHAYNGLRTKRTEPLFQAGGSSYVYLCYGIHHLFNVTTGPAEEAAAVLIRAIQPLSGVEFMMKQRKLNQSLPNLTAGPGRLTKALGISILHNRQRLNETTGIWIEDRGIDTDFVSTTRIGVDYAEEDASLPWRFYLKDNKWVSKL